MSTRVTIWNDAQAKKEIQKRYRNARDARQVYEDSWIRNERAVYGTDSTLHPGGVAGLGGDLLDMEGVTSPGSSNAFSSTGYTFKNFRFMHAQMSSNPPSVVMRPQTSDQDDHRKADAADRVVRYSIRKYSMQEKMDLLCLQTLLYGTGVIKVVWDSGKGAIISEDEETGELQLEGDIAVSNPFTWNIFVDPDAKAADEIKWAIEEIYMDFDEALHRWPGKKDILENARVERNSGPYASYSEDHSTGSGLRNGYYNSVRLLEYWETGLPTNGYLGRKGITTIDGDVLDPVGPSPQRFKKFGAVAEIEAADKSKEAKKAGMLEDAYKEMLIEKLPEQATLPYHFLTDVDVPNSPWGRSPVEWAYRLQMNLDEMDTARLDNLKATAANKLIVPESAELPDDALTDTPWDIIRIAGNQPPYHMSPAQPHGDLTPARMDTIQGINDVMGVNESMFGQQSREQAAAAMQYATNQGNMIRRRLFNKYVLVTESVYKSILSLLRKHWSTSRIINVLGKEKALEAIDIKGTDFDGGYDVVGEYGATLSLDPISRRQEIMTLQPLFEKAGISTRQSLRLMKLSELEGMYDKLDLAANRQKEIFDLMISTGSYIPPKKFRDHENMIAWAYDYFMTSEYEMLPEEIQLLCERHIEERTQLAAQEKAGSAAAAPAPAAGPADPGAGMDGMGGMGSPPVPVAPVA